METIKVLIVDDSAVVRMQIASLLSPHKDIQIVGEGRNGEEAIEMAQKLSPNIITIDLHMPVMNGQEAIEEIMSTKATPILVISDAEESDAAFKAISAGALSLYPKGQLADDDGKQFIQKIRLLSKVKVIKHIRRKRHIPKSLPAKIEMPPGRKRTGNKVLAIASSTGGPKALSIILEALPEDFPCPIVIAQHIADGFVPGLAQWLNSMSKINVKVAEEGEDLKPGTAYLSVPEKNLVLAGERVKYLTAESTDIYHPSCNKLLSSVAETYGRDSIGIILTGMGDDGVLGLKQIKSNGGKTFAQDKESSVVYGMPKVAVEKGAADKTIPIKNMAAEICRLIYR